MASYGNESERMANGANQSANGGCWRRSIGCGEVAARPHPRGGGPGRNEGTGPRGAGHRKRDTPVPTSGEKWRKAHHYDQIIGPCIETVTCHTTYFLTSIVCPSFTTAKPACCVKAG
jgi:hypothetical protein